MKNKILVSFVFVSTLIVVGLIALDFKAKVSEASAPSGLQSTVATSSVAAVSSTASVVFATSTNCSSRIITTQGGAIKITFTDKNGYVPTSTFGHVQVASTTVAYDSGLYGCNTFKVYSYESQTLTVTETR